MNDTTPAGGPVDLESWIRTHGPLDARQTLLLLLDLCGEIDRMSDEDRARAVDSLQIQLIERNPGTGWRWRPRLGEVSTARPTEGDIVERLGIIAHMALSGERLDYPLAGDSEVRSLLRRSRPDLAPGIVDLVVDCLMVRRQRRVNLAGIARSAGALLGVERTSPAGWPLRRVVSGSIVTLLVLVLTASSLRRGDTRDTTGLTPFETTLDDLLNEAAETAAVTDEHTAAIQRYQAIRLALRAHLEATDPRITWSQAHEAWVRTLAGDRLTTEQELEAAPGALRLGLGAGHPYVRTVSLALAATLEARGELARANALRSESEAATRDLFRALGAPVPSLDPWPVPRGVMAHVAPNVPEQEGFRPYGDGGYWRPFTTIQQWTSGRDGWDLHIVSAGACSVSIPVGTDPRPLTVRTSRRADGTWEIALDGARHAVNLSAPESKTVALSLSERAGRPIDINAGSTHSTFELAHERPRASPPYGLAFGDSGADCALVWLEIPYPPEFSFRLR